MRTLGMIARILVASAVWTALLAAQTFTTLYHFGSYEYDGVMPSAAVTLGPQGQIYGTTQYGGEYSLGTVFELSPPASAGAPWTETVLHSFSPAEGQQQGGLVLGPSGALYGVTTTSRTNPHGSAFELDPPTGGSTHWTLALLCQFDYLPVGGGGLVWGAGGSLYGIANNAVYRLTPPTATAGWTETALYTFPPSSAPWGTLAVSSNGTLFGVTYAGGRVKTNPECINGCGTVFSLTPPAVSGGTWTYRMLFGFAPYTGVIPHEVALTPTGVIYGTTNQNGPENGGTAFSLTPAGPGAPMTEATVHAFSGNPDGIEPDWGLLVGPNGALYGTTYSGGVSITQGTIFELIPPSSSQESWTETILHSFSGTDGEEPLGLAMGADGTLYGTTIVGGAFNRGTVYALKP